MKIYFDNSSAVVVRSTTIWSFKWKHLEHFRMFQSPKNYLNTWCSHKQNIENHRICSFFTIEVVYDGKKDALARNNNGHHDTRSFHLRVGWILLFNSKLQKYPNRSWSNLTVTVRKCLTLYLWPMIVNLFYFVKFS